MQYYVQVHLCCYTVVDTGVYFSVDIHEAKVVNEASRRCLEVYFVPTEAVITIAEAFVASRYHHAADSLGCFRPMKLLLIPCSNHLISDSPMMLSLVTCCQLFCFFLFFVSHLSLYCWLPDLIVCGDVHSNPCPPTHRISFNLNYAHPELLNKPTLYRNDINFIHPSNLRYDNLHMVPLYQAHDYPDDLQYLPKIVAIDIETYSEEDPQDLVTHDQLNSFYKNQSEQHKDDEELQLSFINEQRVFLISCIFGFLGSINIMPTVFVTSTHLIINKHGRMNRNVEHSRIKLQPFNVDTTSILPQSEILTKFKCLMTTIKPLFITGHNVSQFNLAVISYRCAFFVLILLFRI
ncbi:hypothetical protein RCL1_002630 [Eukaryota sp. TZLM3-RCL]